MNESSSGVSQAVPDVIVTPAMFKRMNLRRLRHLLTEVRATFPKSQQRYEANFDRQIRFLPTSHRGDWDFVDRPQSKRMADDPEYLAKKFQTQDGGPYNLIAVRDHTVKNLEDALENVVNIYRVSWMPEDRPLPVRPGQKQVRRIPTPDYTSMNTKLKSNWMGVATT